MIFLISILLGIVFLLWAYKEFYQAKTGMVPQSTPEASLAYLAQMIERSADSGTILDLGSCYGGRVFTLARLLPTWEVTGVEQSLTPWIVGNLRSIRRNYGNYRFFWDDPGQWPLKDYSVIFIHQNDKTIKKWEASIAKRLQPGTLLISYNRPFPRIRPIDTISVTSTNTLYIYKKPPPSPDSGTEPTLPIETAVPIPPPVSPAVESNPEIQPQQILPL
ncbi:MAG: class SAM-dependent methyltransferase [Alphaproteobacteria bacterium]|nr:class SAM-dependent methyltransferase [Alphaproteobacteria bacterium]